MDSDSSDDYLVRRKKPRVDAAMCPYISSVNRYLLDFDFDKVCSVTLSNTNVYACLVCGKYFQGRGKGTPAYVHSMEQDHHIFLNLDDEKVWCIPDNYEVVDKSFDDIKSNLNPKFTAESIKSLPTSALSLTGSEYLPGLVGLNQIKDSSYLNAAIHALCAVQPFRDILLLLDTTQAHGRLLGSLADLVKKMTNSGSFKGIVSPHDFLQRVSVESSSEFFASTADPFKFMDWLLPSLGYQKITSIFQGSTEKGPFLTVSVDLPPMPVFKDDTEFIPTVSLSDLLESRFAEETITKFPQFLILKFNRFVKNNFFIEKNSTIVRFPLTNLPMGRYADMSDVSHNYSLVSTVCHEGKADAGSYTAYVLHPTSDQWCECSGLRVKKILPQSVALVESYIQIWKKV